MIKGEALFYFFFSLHPTHTHPSTTHSPPSSQQHDHRVSSLPLYPHTNTALNLFFPCSSCYPSFTNKTELYLSPNYTLALLRASHTVNHHIQDYPETTRLVRRLFHGLDPIICSRVPVNMRHQHHLLQEQQKENPLNPSSACTLRDKTSYLLLNGKIGRHQGANGSLDMVKDMVKGGHVYPRGHGPFHHWRYISLDTHLTPFKTSPLPCQHCQSALTARLYFFRLIGTTVFRSRYRHRRRVPKWQAWPTVFSLEAKTPLI